MIAAAKSPQGRAWVLAARQPASSRRARCTRNKRAPARSVGLGRGIVGGRARSQPTASQAQGECSSETAAGSGRGGAGLALGRSFGGRRGSAVLLRSLGAGA